MAGDDGTGREPAGPWCQWCGQFVIRAGREEEGGLAHAVHALTGLEQAPDGHLAAPIDHEPLLWKDAREVTAEYDGIFTVTARFRILRADWARLPAGGSPVTHYEARDRKALAALLDAALADSTVRMSALRAGGGAR